MKVWNRILLGIFAIGFSLAQMGGCGGGKNGSDTTTIVQGGVPSLIFSQTTPAADAVNVDVRPTFAWTAAEGATSYALQISTASDFSTVTIQQEGITTTSHSITVDLLRDTLYHWRVYASGGGISRMAGNAPLSFRTIPATAPPQAFTQISPSHGTIGTGTTPTLSWNPSTGASSYRVEVSLSNTFGSTVVNQPNLTTTSYTVTPALSSTTTYYWRVTASNSFGSTQSSGAPWSFTTGNGAIPPGASTLLSPANSAVNVPLLPTFTWSTSVGATSYILHVTSEAGFGGRLDVNESTTSTSFTLTAPLAGATTYRWQVLAVNAAGSTPPAQSFQFQTAFIAPSAFTMTAPVNGATGVVLAPNFQWAASTGAATYTLQISENGAFAPMVVDKSGIQGTESVSPVGLTASKLYYWRVLAVNPAGTTQASTAPFSFTTAAGGALPGNFSLVAPTFDATGVATNPAYQWGESVGRTTFTLEVAETTAFDPIIYSKFNLATTTYQPMAFFLQSNKAYYWRVKAVNASGSTMASGAPWKFTTAPAAPALPGAFDLTTPAKNATSVTVSPTFAWQASTGATSYSLRISETLGGASRVIDGITGTSYALPAPALLYHKTYYWYVVAFNGTGGTNSTSTFSFQTEDGPLGTFNKTSPFYTVVNGVAVWPTNYTRRPSFSWTASANAISYKIRVGTNYNWVAGTYVEERNITDQDAATAGVQYTLQATLNGGTLYYWDVWAVNATGEKVATWVAYFQFTTMANPESFNLALPANNTIDAAFQPAFSWTPSLGAAGYRLEVSSNVTFWPNVVDQKDIAGTSLACPITLNANTTYWWRVTASTTSGTSVAGPWAFTVKNARPSAFTLVLPAKGANNVDSTNPTFSWNASIGATSYTLQVARDTSFVEFIGNTLPVNVAGITKTSYTTNVTLSNGATYYWRIKAVNNVGETISNDQYWTFSTPFTWPSAAALTSPANGANISVLPTFTWNTAANASTYTFQIAPDAGFGAPVVNVPDLSATSYTPTATLNRGASYYWRVLSVNGIGATASAAWSFVYNPAPDAPTLLSPANNATNIVSRPNFSWSAAAGAQVYSVQVSRLNDFSTIEQSKDGILTTSYALPTDLQGGVTYYWRVKAVNVVGSTPSAVWSFKTWGTGLPGAFALLSPASGSTVTTLTPTLGWNASSFATSYTVQINTKSDFTGTVLTNRTGVIGTTFTVPIDVLVPASWYYWRVYAVNTAGSTLTSSTVWSFRTDGNLPGNFSLATPDANATNVSTQPTFSWSASANAQSYTLVANTAADFTGMTLINQSLTGTSYVPASPLPTGTTIHWRVSAFNAMGFTAASNGPRSFTTTGAAAAPGAFTLTSPANSAAGVTNFTFQWTSSLGATSYRLEIAKGSDFAVKVLDKSVVGTRFMDELTSYAGNTIYYWRVTAVNNLGSTPSSSGTWMFKTGTVLP